MEHPNKLQGTVVCPWCNHKQEAEDAHTHDINGVTVFECASCHSGFTEQDTEWKGRY